MSKLQFTLPFLRFKEFSDDYIFIKLDQISELQKNGSLSKTDIHNEGKFKCILYGELFTTYDSIIKSESILSKTNKMSKLLTNSNCIVFPSSSTTLVDFFPCSSIKTSGVMLGQDINCFFVNDNNSSDYLSYFFSKKSNKIKIFRLTEGSTINHLYGNYLKNFTMCISNNIKEQIKISKFFSLLDKHIELWERKLQLCLLKKKYYLNKLYIDNDLFPHLRFKEFNNGESKYKCDNLFNLCSFVKSGGTPASTNKDYYSGNIPFCSISDFDKNYLKCTKKYISDQAILDSSSFIFPKNNILLSIYASIGEVAINLIDVALPQSILGIIVSKIDLYYLFHLLQTNNIKRFFVNYSEQGTQPNLSKKTLKFLKI